MYREEIETLKINRISIELFTMNREQFHHRKMTVHLAAVGLRIERFIRTCLIIQRSRWSFSFDSQRCLNIDFHLRNEETRKIVLLYIENSCCIICEWRNKMKKGISSWIFHRETQRWSEWGRLCIQFRGKTL